MGGGYDFAKVKPLLLSLSRASCDLFFLLEPFFPPLSLRRSHPVRRRGVASHVASTAMRVSTAVPLAVGTALLTLLSSGYLLGQSTGSNLSLIHI